MDNDNLKSFKYLLEKVKMKYIENNKIPDEDKIEDIYKLTVRHFTAKMMIRFDEIQAKKYKDKLLEAETLSRENNI